MIPRFLKRLGLALLIVGGGSAGRAWQEEYVRNNPEEGKFRLFLAIGTVLLVIGIACCVTVVALNYPQIRSGFWPTTHGIVEVSEARRFRSGTIALQLRYSYTVNGVSYGSSRRAITDAVFTDIRFAIEESDRYPVGQAVAVFYDPGDPVFAILEPGYDLMSDLLFLSGLCTCIGGIGFLLLHLAWSVSKPTADPYRTPRLSG